MFGKRLNKVRKTKGFTAQYMADYLSVTLRTYRNYESESSYPDFDKLVRIADLLDVSTDWLLGRDEWLTAHEAHVDVY